jgi:membrane protease YdiL (CAAX protease family)
MMATELIQPAVEPHSRAKLTTLVYAALFMIATSGSFYFLTMSVLIPDYYRHLVDTDQSGLLRLLERNLPLTQGLFSLIQLTFALAFFRPLVKQMFAFRGVPPLNRSARNILLGVSTGLIALLATAFPNLLGNRQPSETVTFLANHFYSVSGLGLALLLVFMLPVTAEIFFRGIFLSQLLENISVVSAIVVSTLLFLLSWPAFNLIAAAALGLAAGILFYRTRSMLACVVANVSFTVGIITLQISRLP